MDPARVEQVVGLLSRHQEEIFRHILALLPHEADARDILQETCIAIYRKAEEYNPQRSFALWAFGFARMEVLKHRSRTQRKTILLSTELIEMLAQERESLQFQLHERLTALEQCVVALPAEDRDLLRRRYNGEASVDDLLKTVTMSRRTLMRRFERIRRVLFECVSRRLMADEALPVDASHPCPPTSC